MNNLHEYIGLIIAIIVVLIVIEAQIYSFLKTKKKISKPILSPKGFEAITKAHWKMS